MTESTRPRRITATICSRNRSRRLAKAIDGLLNQTLAPQAYEILVVDNASKDNTRQVVESFTAATVPVRYSFESQLGVSHARNRAIQDASTPIIAFVDDDCLPDRHWLESLLAGFDQEQRRPLAIGGPIELLWEAPRPDWLDESKLPYLGRLDLGSEPRSCGPGELLYCSNLAFDRQFLIDSGGFVTSLGHTDKQLMGNEELEIETRLLRAGGTLLYEPGARIQHAVPAERTTVSWFLRRSYSQGKSDALTTQILPGFIEERPLLAPRILGWLGRIARRPDRRTLISFSMSVAYSLGELRMSRFSGNLPAYGRLRSLPHQLKGYAQSPGSPLQPGELGHRLRRLTSRIPTPGYRPGSEDAPLIAASTAGDVRRIEALLASGAPIDMRGHLGRTALHEAVLAGHSEAAACLLVHGADPEIEDQRGRRPLDLDFVDLPTLHAIRQRYHRWPAGEGREAAASAEVRDWVEALTRNGIVRVPGFVEPERLIQMQADMQTFVDQLSEMLAQGQGRFDHYDEEEHFWPDDQAYVTNNAFKYSPALAELCGRGPLAAAADLYMGKPAFIQRGVGMRYLPSRTTENDMFGWHHDMEEKRFKVMFLLSDVGPQDQHMSYVLGSHKLFHPYRMFLRNQCSLDYCRQHLPRIEVLDATGKAGDIFLFDSNGAHRGQRRETGSMRDVFLVEYSSDLSEIWGADLDPAVMARLPSPNALEPLGKAPKKWHTPQTRKLPSWAENLPQVERWLQRPDRRA